MTNPIQMKCPSRVLLLGALLLSLPVHALQPGRLPDATLARSSGDATQLKPYFGKPVVLFYEDPEAAESSQPAKEKLRELSERYGLRKFIDLIVVANLEKLNWWPARPIAFSAVRTKEKEAQVPVLIDLNGALRDAPWHLDPKVTNVLVVAPDGTLLYHSVGKLEGARFDRLRKVLEALLESTMSAEAQEQALARANPATRAAE